jgi:hypothetical protein
VWCGEAARRLARSSIARSVNDRACFELTTKRQEDLQGGRPDYHVYAGSRLVGRIYQNTRSLFGSEIWFWGVQGIFTSIETGQMHGSAESFEEAKSKLRTAFDLWLSWARFRPRIYLTWQYDVTCTMWVRLLSSNSRCPMT